MTCSSHGDALNAITFVEVVSERTSTRITHNNIIKDNIYHGIIRIAENHSSTVLWILDVDIT